MPCSRTQHGLTRVGLEPRPLDPESEALTIRPPRSPAPKWLFSYCLNVNNHYNTVSLITRSISMDPKDSVIMN